MGHGHDHGPAPRVRLQLALGLTLSTMGIEVAGGLVSGSLALLSDAGHMVADAGALGLALYAQTVAERPRTASRTYGSRRAETLAAFVNALLLVVTALGILREVWGRWGQPPAVEGGILLGVATFGLLANLGAAALLSRSQSANTRAAFAHVMADAAGSVAAILAGVAVLAFDWARADVAASAAVAALILWSAGRLITESMDVLMEGVPTGLEVETVESTIRQTPGVADLHDLHVWRISDGFDVVTVHVVLDGQHHGTEVAQAVARRVRDHHHITHVTVQPEAGPSASVPLSAIRRR